MPPSAIVRHRTTLIRTFFSSSSSPSSSTRKPTSLRKPPLLWQPEDSKDASHLQLLSWGRGSSGQLGSCTEETWIYPTPVFSILLPAFRLSPSPGSLSPQTPVQEAVEVGISCGLFHSTVLLDGQFWVWGKGDGGRLGLGHENFVFVPTLNPHLRNVRWLALGGLHSVALTSLGQVFTWGYGGFGALGHSVYTRELVPRLVEGSWSEKIKHIATSGTHTAAVAESGTFTGLLPTPREEAFGEEPNTGPSSSIVFSKCLAGALYTWGREEGDGRLGLGPGRGPDLAGGLSVPCKVKALPVPVDAVACGGFFTLALTEQGQLWSWGANSNYELGRGDKVGGWQPKVVPSLEHEQVVQIACGGYHSLALTEDGKVLSWGHGGHGQLGHSSILNQKVPAVIQALAEERVISVACGGSSSAAVTESGKLYMWGNAKDSQLGVPGLPDIQPSPIEVKFLMEDDNLEPHNVLSVAIGASHAMCLVSRSGSC